MLISDDKKLKIPEPDFLHNLNKEQKTAVLNTEGPLLVLCGLAYSLCQASTFDHTTQISLRLSLFSDSI